MSGVLIVEPLPIAAIAVSSGTGRDNLLTPSPREIWLAGNSEAQGINIDMGAVVTVDSFFLGSTNAAAGATWTINRATGMGTGLTQIKAAGPMRAADSLGPHHAFHRLAAPVTSRYFRISLFPADGPPLFAGNIALGLALEGYRDFGGGRQPMDTATRENLSDGGFGAGGGVVKAVFNWSFSEMDDAVVHKLWAMSLRVGLRQSFVVVEDADLAIGRNEAIHWGVFQRFQPYQRRDVADTRWDFTHEEWR